MGSFMLKNRPQKNRYSFGRFGCGFVRSPKLVLLAGAPGKHNGPFAKSGAQFTMFAVISVAARLVVDARSCTLEIS